MFNQLSRQRVAEGEGERVGGLATDEWEDRREMGSGRECGRVF